MPDRPFRVAVDARSVNTGHLRGIGKSVYELIKRTAASGAVEWHLLADRPDRPMQVADPGACDVSVFETRGDRFHAWEQWSLPRRARQLGVDVLHAPGTSMPWWQPVPTVVTIHDTIPWQHQDPAWPAGFYKDKLLPAAYHRAAAVTTVSECSRRDILSRWPHLQPRLHVISPGVDERYLDAESDRQPVQLGDRVLTEPYLLYIGGSDPRKRLMWALQAWWGAAPCGASLVVCGVDVADHDNVRRMVPRQLQDRLVLAPFVSEEDMPRLYMRADAVLYPTLYEGFGLPVVEAQAVGTPVLFSDVGSLAELKGPGAVVLPVDDLPAWVRTITNILQSRDSIHGPDRIARAWARQYSWDAYTERTLAVYEAVGEKRPAQHGRGHGVQQGAAS
ncbi:MAG: glycosyltransferase family 4 protein [Vicinamibacterales bacterium]